MLEALTVDAAARDALFGRPFRGRVHSVFAKTVNFIGPRERLYCLAAEELDDAPATVRVRRPAGLTLDGIGITPGDAVETVAGGLVCGPVLLNAAKAVPWTASLPAFPSQPAGGRCLGANLAVLRAVICACGQGGGLKAYLTGRAGTVLERQLAERATALAAVLAAGETAAIVAAGRRLIGLGLGLTPSGDDFLAGLMLTFNMPAAPFGRRHRAAAAALTAGAATGTVSRAMLGHAARGHTRAGVVVLLTALAAGTADDVAAAVRRVLNCGATSGTDLAVGLAAGLAIGRELAGEREE